MFDTIPDYVYRFRHYFKFNWEEVIGFIVTAVFAGFILTFNEWGEEKFEVALGIRALIVMSLFLLVTLFVTVLAIKLVSLRIGYEVYYEPHLLGMMFGLVICVASAGWLPIFLPGGFRFHQPMRMYVGHWRGYMRTYYIPAICGAVPMLMLLYVTILSPIYIATGSEIIARFIVALLLFAVYSLIPLPNVALEYGGRVLDFFRYFKGMTFGLAIYMNSRTWFAGLGAFVLVFSVLAYLLTYYRYRASLLVYVIALILGLLWMWFYKEKVEGMKGYPDGGPFKS
jgi:hypothetical protein